MGPSGLLAFGLKVCYDAHMDLLAQYRKALQEAGADERALQERFGLSEEQASIIAKSAQKVQS